VKGESIPTPAVQRLSLYLRQLEKLAQEGVSKISSRDLAEYLHVTSAQVRKDLAYFGQFGQPGVGYRVEPLISELKHVLGTDRTWRVVVLGVGNLGRALLQYRGFRPRGFELVAAFDIAPDKIGKTFGGVRVRHVDEIRQVVSGQSVKLGVIATPAGAAQEAADLLCQAGIKGILNFAPTTLETPWNVAVGPVDLAAALEQLCFQINTNK